MITKLSDRLGLTHLQVFEDAGYGRCIKLSMSVAHAVPQRPAAVLPVDKQMLYMYAGYFCQVFLLVWFARAVKV